MQIQINALDRLSSDGFVVTVHWTTVQTQGEYTASQYGTESFTQEQANFIPYDQLTPEIVTGWLETRWGPEGMAAKQAALDQSIANQANPPVVSGLPWSN